MQELRMSCVRREGPNPGRAEWEMNRELTILCNIVTTFRIPSRRATSTANVRKRNDRERGCPHVLGRGKLCRFTFARKLVGARALADFDRVRRVFQKIFDTLRSPDDE